MSSRLLFRYGCYYSLSRLLLRGSPLYKPRLSLIKNECNLKRELSSINTGELSRVEFERVCSETLESLCDFFEVLVESRKEFSGGDVTYSDGVLTVNLGPQFGIYVINRQSPNRQIWLSSPNSGPKRYDYDPQRETWVYKHDELSLHSLLKLELSNILNDNVDLSSCSFSEKTL